MFLPKLRLSDIPGTTDTSLSVSIPTVSYHVVLFDSTFFFHRGQPGSRGPCHRSWPRWWMKKWANIPMAPIQVPAANISAGCARQFYHPTPYTTWPCQLSWSSHHCRLESTSRHWTIAEVWTNISRNEPSHRCRKDYSPPLQSPFPCLNSFRPLGPEPGFPTVYDRFKGEQWNQEALLHACGKPSTNQSGCRRRRKRYTGLPRTASWTITGNDPGYPVSKKVLCRF